MKKLPNAAVEFDASIGELLNLLRLKNADGVEKKELSSEALKQIKEIQFLISALLESDGVGAEFQIVLSSERAKQFSSGLSKICNCATSLIATTPLFPSFGTCDDEVNPVEIVQAMAGLINSTATNLLVMTWNEDGPEDTEEAQS